MKVEIKRSELETVRKKLERDKGYFLSPCRDCEYNNEEDCDNKIFCEEKQEYEKLWSILKVLEAYDIPNGFIKLAGAAAELEKAKKSYSESVESLEKQLSNLFIIEDLSTKHTVVKGQ